MISKLYVSGNRRRISATGHCNRHAGYLGLLHLDEAACRSAKDRGSEGARLLRLRHQLPDRSRPRGHRRCRGQPPRRAGRPLLTAPISAWADARTNRPGAAPGGAGPHSRRDGALGVITSESPARDHGCTGAGGGPGRREGRPLQFCGTIAKPGALASPRGCESAYALTPASASCVTPLAPRFIQSTE